MRVAGGRSWHRRRLRNADRSWRHDADLELGARGFETPTGSYRIQRKVIKDWSRPYRAWMPYASYFVGGYALHEGAVPTYPASHGCVRLTTWHAADAYRFATIGTSVLVY